MPLYMNSLRSFPVRNRAPKAPFRAMRGKGSKYIADRNSPASPVLGTQSTPLKVTGFVQHTSE